MNRALQLLSILGLFILDISGIMLFKVQIIHFVLCFYLVALFRNAAALPLVCAVLCICFESLIMYDSLTAPLIYLLPATALILFLKKMVTPHPIYPPLALSFCLALQSWLLHQGNLGDPYTMWVFIANLIVILSCSLIW